MHRFSVMLIVTLVITAPAIAQYRSNEGPAAKVICRQGIREFRGFSPARNAGACQASDFRPWSDQQFVAQNPASTQTPTQNGPRYFLTEIPTLGGSENFAYALNDLGQLVGSSGIAGSGSHAYLYSQGTITDLYPLNSQGIQTVGPTGINDFGQITSGLIDNGVYVPAVFDSRTGQSHLLGTLGGVTSYGFNGVATDINSWGHAVGYSYLDPLNRHGFLYQEGVLTDIGSFGGYSAALAINDWDAVTGFASDSVSGVARAFEYVGGTMWAIGPVTESYGEGINNAGGIVGQYLTADGSAFHAFLYLDGEFLDLGMTTSPETVAYAINDWGQIAVTSWQPYMTTCDGTPCTQYQPTAYVYLDGTPTNLNSTIPSGRSDWYLAWAFDINNLGQIVGYGVVNSNFRAFLLTPAINKHQCQKSAWMNYGFTSQAQCEQFVDGKE